MSSYKKHLAFIVLACLSSIALAQVGDPNLTRETMNIRKEYVPQISDPVRIDSQPAMNDSAVDRLPVAYDIIPLQIPISYRVDTIAAATIKREPVSKLYRNHLKAGFGMYTTPYLSFMHSGARSTKGRYGLELLHHSSSGKLKDVGPADFSNNKAKIFGERYFDEHTLSGAFNFDRNVVHRYGYTPGEVIIEKDSTKQRYNRYGVEADLKRSMEDSSAWLYAAGLGYFNTGSLDSASENNVRLKGHLFKYLDSELFGGYVEADYFNNRTAFDTLDFGIIKVNPEVSSRGKLWQLRAGMNIFFEMQTDEVSKAHFFPNAEFRFNVIDNILIPYVGIDGGVYRNSFDKMSRENPFILSTVPLQNTISKWRLFGGIKGALSKQISFSTHASYGEYQNMPFFVIDGTVPSRNSYTIVYDTAKMLNVQAEIAYTVSEKLNVRALADFYEYDLKTEEHPWHKPLFAATVGARYSLFSKIIAKADIYYLGERRGLDPFQSAGSSIDVVNVLDPVLDLNLGIEYRYTRKLSGFLQFNNVTADHYYRWTNYPSQRFQILGGITLIF